MAPVLESCCPRVGFLTKGFSLSGSGTVGIWGELKHSLSLSHTFALNLYFLSFFLSFSERVMTTLI